MFTGIIETTGKIVDIISHGTNKSFWLQSSIVNELKIDQSVSHDGVCLTIEAIENDKYKVTAIEETLKKTNLATWRRNGEVNIERCMQMNGRLDGHIVQGHVDATAKCVELKTLEGSWEYTFEYPETFASLLIEKGSVAVNGTSLTCFNVTKNTFTVAIIPYTYEHTSIKQVKPESIVNIEFDVIGKYIQRFESLK
ncbi:riboflavin synthase subunit alpha [Arachidicoccus ginsenosidimutans]|uniref:riboflavin synthase n=1 Tax=Arachidicoccus sp. BS20 TaxID=1850526 RepID=UPI0007F0E6F5|nr:riboflavin synthase [Arachidicoccus sp. BS20]ANI88114.1 riboflavin synthase subunit alpha [Arachidicoccus sp. BS20]